MPTLRETQEGFARALLIEDCAAIAPLIVAGAFRTEERLNIYRNTYLATLIKALRLSYPAVQRLVGEEFFGAAAEAFVRGAPPVSAYLNDYGARFPDFLAAFAPAQTLPYLADVARLEWAVNLALHAPDTPPLGSAEVSAIAGLAPEQLVLTPHPGFHLLRLEHPGDLIWRAVLNEDEAALGSIDPGAGPVWLMVERGSAGAEVRRLEPAAWRFTAMLCEGRSFAQALAAAPEADAAALLALHLTAGRFIDFGERT